MKTLMTAGVAGLLLSGAALAQDDWAYIQCTFDEARRLANDENGRVDEPVALQAIVFRFNSRALDQYNASSSAWISQCDPAVSWQTLECSISSDEINASFRMQDGSSVYTSSIHVNRVTGAITYERRTGRTDSWYFDRTDATGRCAPTEDPTGGRRAF